MPLKFDLPERYATLKLSHDAASSTLSARVPTALSSEEFGRLSQNAYDVISKLTNHACLSGRIKFVVEDPLVSGMTRINLENGATF